MADIFREYPFRFIGFGAAIGEAVRGRLSSTTVDLLYGTSVTYVLGHIVSEVRNTYAHPGPHGPIHAFVHTALFDAAASVLVPLFVATNTRRFVKIYTKENKLPDQWWVKWGPSCCAVGAVLLSQQHVDQIVEWAISSMTGRVFRPRSHIAKFTDISGLKPPGPGKTRITDGTVAVLVPQAIVGAGKDVNIGVKIGDHVLSGEYDAYKSEAPSCNLTCPKIEIPAPQPQPPPEPAPCCNPDPPPPPPPQQEPNCQHTNVVVNLPDNSKEFFIEKEGCDCDVTGNVNEYDVKLSVSSSGIDALSKCDKEYYSPVKSRAEENVLRDNVSNDYRDRIQLFNITPLNTPPRNYVRSPPGCCEEWDPYSIGDKSNLKSNDCKPDLSSSVDTPPESPLLDKSFLPNVIFSPNSTFKTSPHYFFTDDESSFDDNTSSFLYNTPPMSSWKESTPQKSIFDMGDGILPPQKSPPPLSQSLPVSQTPDFQRSPSPPVQSLSPDSQPYPKTPPPSPPPMRSLPVYTQPIFEESKSNDDDYYASCKICPHR